MLNENLFRKSYTFEEKGHIYLQDSTIGVVDTVFTSNEGCHKFDHWLEAWFFLWSIYRTVYMQTRANANTSSAINQIELQ